MKFLYADLVKSSIYTVLLSRLFQIFLDVLVGFWYEVLLSRHSIASCAKTSSCCSSEPDLLLFRSYCGLYLAHWLPILHTLWGLLPVQFSWRKMSCYRNPSFKIHSFRLSLDRPLHSLSDKDRNFIYPHIPCDDIVHTDSNVWLYLYVPGDSSKLVCCWLLDYLAYLRSNFNTAKGDAWGWCMNLRPSSGRPQFLRTDGWVEDRDFVPNIGEMWILTRHGNTMGQWSAHQNKTSRRCTLGNSRKEGFVDFSLIHRDGPTIETQCPLHFVTPR